MAARRVLALATLAALALAAREPPRCAGVAPRGGFAARWAAGLRLRGGAGQAPLGGGAAGLAGMFGAGKARETEDSSEAWESLRKFAASHGMPAPPEDRHSLPPIRLRARGAARGRTRCLGRASARARARPCCCSRYIGGPALQRRVRAARRTRRSSSPAVAMRGSTTRGSATSSTTCQTLAGLCVSRAVVCARMWPDSAAARTAPEGRRWRQGRGGAQCRGDVVLRKCYVRACSHARSAGAHSDTTGMPSLRHAARPGRAKQRFPAAHSPSPLPPSGSAHSQPPARSLASSRHSSRFATYADRRWQTRSR